MKTYPISYAGWLVWALCASLALLPARAPAEDIDIFKTDTGVASKFDNPNVLIILDNTSNYSNNAQKWADRATQGESELAAIRAVVSGLDDSINVGLMMFSDIGSGPSGGYIRFPVVQMTADVKPAGAPADYVTGNKTRFLALIDSMLADFGNPADKVGSSMAYSPVLFDAFKYFGGYTSPANVASGAAGAPTDREHFGPTVFNTTTNPALAAVPGALAADTATPVGAGGYTDGSRNADPKLSVAPTTYRPPITSDNKCAKNYIIFVGNTFPNDDKADYGAVGKAYLKGVGGNSTQLAVPGYTEKSTQTKTVIIDATHPAGYTNSCTAACSTTEFAAYCGTGKTYESCECTGSTKTAFDSCPAGQNRYSIVASKTGPSSTTSGNTALCYTSPPPTSGLTGNQFGMTCPAGSSCTYSIGTTSTDTGLAACGSLGTAPVTSSLTTSCHATAPAARTANDLGGLSTLPLAVVTAVNSGTGQITTTTYTLDTKTGYSWGNPSDATGCPATTARYTVTMPVLTSTTVSSHYKVTQTAAGVTSTIDAGYTFACSATAPGALTASDPACPAGYTCSIGSAYTGAAACTSGSRWEVRGINTTTEVVSNGIFAVPAVKDQRMADEWTRFLYQTDVNSAAGQQNVSTYTIDVFNARQDGLQTQLLMSMARVGGGKYFAAKSETAIVNALKNIMSEIQAVNTVFASASLPVNATNRAQNENQVFIGMFRPDTKPRWYGNVKRYQLYDFDGVIDLADSTGNATTKNPPPLRAVNLQTGFISECATSYWTTDTSTAITLADGTKVGYWYNVPSNPPAEGKCTTSSNNPWSDAPDGPQVEKGAVAEVLRQGNGAGSLSPWPRKLYTLNSSGSQVDFTSTVSGLSATLADFVLGRDVNDENGNGSTTGEVRPSVHGDVVHSRPLPVNYSTKDKPNEGVTVFYGANDGWLRAVNATSGTERWAFMAPEFFATSTARDKFQRQSDSDGTGTKIKYPSSAALAGERKDYFWDGSIGIYQDEKNTDIRIFPTMRRGGRMLYALNVTDNASPTYLWKLGCPNQDNDVDCVAPFAADLDNVKRIGQTWSMPSVAFIKGVVNTDPTVPEPVLVMGGGYDKCEDDNLVAPGCASPPKGSAVYVIRARDGKILRMFETTRSVPGDIAMVDVNNDGKVDYAYAADTGGNLYRADFVDTSSSYAGLLPDQWNQYRVAYTNGSGRKFFYPPALLSVASGYVYAALGSGDREHPLAGDYPFGNVTNRFYVYLDQLSFKPTTTGDPDATKNSVNLDGTSMNNMTTVDSTNCTPAEGKVLPGAGKKGWFMDLNQYGAGEQTVTSALILGGLVTFSTNRPIPSVSGSCSTTLGEARGYWVNLLNGSGGVGVDQSKSCGGERSATFVGGGLPPSPVTGTVPIDGVSRTVVIGAVQRDGSASAPVGGQKVVPAVKAVRKRVYWFKNIDG